MCRWFTYISPTENALLSDLLITPKHSISRQVNDHYLPRLFAHKENDTPSAEHEADVRNRLLNVDGFGMAWYTTSRMDFKKKNSGQDDEQETNGPSAVKTRDDLRPAVYKNITSAIGDSNFRSICHNTETRCCVAHIRATSASAVQSINNHPFVFGRLCFAHNGEISEFVRIRRALCDILDNDLDTYSQIIGSTDSEHLGALAVHYLTGGRGKASWDEEYTVQQLSAALRQAIATVIDLQKKIIGPEFIPNSLNLVITDGTKMVAYRFRNHATEQPPTLYYSTRAGVTLNRKFPDHPDGIDMPEEEKASKKDADEHGAHVIVASEPSTYREQDWDLIGKNQILLVDRDGSAKLEDLDYDQAWNGKDDVQVYKNAGYEE